MDSSREKLVRAAAFGVLGCLVVYIAATKALVPPPADIRDAEKPIKLNKNKDSRKSTASEPPEPKPDPTDQNPPKPEELERPKLDPSPKADESTPATGETPPTNSPPRDETDALVAVTLDTITEKELRDLPGWTSELVNAFFSKKDDIAPPLNWSDVDQLPGMTPVARRQLQIYIESGNPRR